MNKILQQSYYIKSLVLQKSWINMRGGRSPEENVVRSFRGIFNEEVLYKYFTYTGVTKKRKNGRKLKRLPFKNLKTHDIVLGI